ncbi:MAG TPA: AarF/UbiB family protein [Anaerolineaceae bacterium]|nr:AarF/UbiB family protein [Anaerolineaceae bacterium]
MIKVGQFLSARLDVLPREVTDVLSGLQDEVSPERFEDIRQVVETEFNRPIEELYQDFDVEPMAAASIGQVHRARLEQKDADGVSNPVSVVVKIQRPRIQEIVDTDLSALRVVGHWLNALSIIRRRANVPALLNEFSRSLYEEIDYLHEGKNAETFAKNFSQRPEVRVPGVYWERTTRRVLTLEDVQAIKITDYDAIEAAEISRSDVADRLFKTYLQQIFEDRFFHADPHPGNLFILPKEKIPGEPRGWQLVFVDFGMAGEVSPGTMNALREMFIAVGTRDAARVVKAYQMLGILLPGADLDLLEKAGERVFERFWGRSTVEIMNMGLLNEKVEFIREFGELLYEMPFQVPENLILLGRTLAILSGICSGLDPNFNLWTSVAPFADQLISKETGNPWKLILSELTSSLTALVTLPRKADAVLSKLEQGRLEVRAPQLADQISRLERSQRRMSFAILFVGLLFGGIQLFLSGYIWIAGGIELVAIIIFIISILL